MISLNLVFNGLEGSQHSLRRCHYPEDSKPAVTGSSCSFLGKVTHLEEFGSTKLMIIDNAIKVMTVSDKVRQDCKTELDTLNNKTTKTFLATLITGVAGLAISVIVGLAFPQIIVTAFAAAAISLAILGISIQFLIRSKEIEQELSLWEDPAEHLCKQRQRLAKNGIREILDNESVKAFASDEELVFLWKEYLKDCKRIAKHLNEHGTQDEKALFVKDYFENGPYSEKVKKLGLKIDEQNAAEKYKSLVVKYSKPLLTYCDTQLASLQQQSKALSRTISQLDPSANPANPNMPHPPGAGKMTPATGEANPAQAEPKKELATLFSEVYKLLV